MAANRSRAGRPAASKASKVLRGTFRKDRVPKAPAEASLAKSPPPPEWLTEIGKAEWKRAGKELVARELLRQSDLMPFAVYCDAVSTWRSALTVIAARGLTMEVETKGGGVYEQQRPEVSIAHQARKQVIDFSREFFLTPSSAKLSQPTGGKPAGDDWDKF
jgi:P27 family predicted phage terminase small subunit